MATQQELSWKLDKTLASLPDTVRGTYTQLNSTRVGDRMCYGAGPIVVIRSIKDPSISDYFLEHKSRVTVAAFSPNGEWIASGDETGNVYVWAVGSKIVKNRAIACKKVLDLSWSADGQRIVAVGDGNESKAKIFAWDSNNNFGVIEFHSKPILSCAFRPERPFRIVTCGEDLCVNMYEGPPFRFSTSFTQEKGGHSRFPNCVRYDAKGTRFASVGADSKIFVYDGKDGKLQKSLDAKEGHKGAIYSFSWSPDGKQILTASADKTCKLWDVDAGTVVKTFNFSQKPTTDDMQVSTLWHHDGTLISLSLSGAINYLDINNPDQPARIIQGHKSPLRGFAVDRKSNTLFVGDTEGHIVAWNLTTGAGSWFTGAGHGRPIAGLALTADSKLLSVGLDDRVRVNDIKTGAFGADAQALGGYPVTIVASKMNPALAIVALANDKLVVLNDGKVADTVSIPFTPTSVALRPDDAEIVVGAPDCKVYTFPLSGFKINNQPTVLTANRAKVIAVQYNNDGSLILAADNNREIIVYKDQKQQNSTGWCLHSAPAVDLAFSPSGNCMASAGSDQDIFFWQDFSAEFSLSHQRAILAHSLGVVNVAFVDDNTLVSAGVDRAIKIWKKSSADGKDNKASK